MKYPNAHDGVKKIFVAEILSLIGSFLSAIVLGFSLLGIIAIEENSDTGAVAAFGGIALFGLAAAVILIIAFIMQIIGVNRAAIDEPAFKTALYLIIAGIVISLLSSFFGNNATVQAIFSIISDVIQLAITIFIIQGIRNLAVKLNNPDMDAKGNNIFKIICAVYILIFIARIITLIFNGTASKTIAGVFTIIAAVLTILQYVFYLLYLRKARFMLEA